MELKINDIYSGFRLIKEKKVEELDSIGRVFIHEKTGARVLNLENTDDNKVFGIGFRTPPTDSTGVAHIVEHSVLAGSRKYTTREPFMDMIKGSLQTFINAFTYPDKTIYPVASRNDKDFKNLMDVYLDAVFYPLIYKKPEIFMQEGWHYEIFDKEDPIEYKGVVYNEMKGAYSSPESIVSDTLSESLYPDSCYRHSSGGNPKHITDLTEEDFLNFHKKYYHPSNSYIYIYGDGNILENLKHINDEYLSNFDKLDIDSSIPKQKPFEKRREVVKYYNLSDDDKEENKAYLGLNFVLGNSADPIDNLMSNLLDDILINSSAAPLKRALLEKGIGEDIFSMSTGGIDTGFSIIAKNTDESKKEEFEKIVFETLEELVEKGINKEQIKATLNVIEYNLREAGGFPTKGLIYMLNAYESWLYDEDPLTLLEYNETIKFLKDQLNTDFYENYIRKNILENNHSALMLVKPKKGLAREENENIKEKLSEFKNSLSDKELDELIEKNRKLKEYQTKDDTEEDKASLPKLSLNDIEDKVEDIPQEVINKENFTALYHDIFTSGISYISFLFDSSMVKEEELPYLAILGHLLGDLDTENFNYEDLDNQVYMTTGGINFGPYAHSHKSNDSLYYPKFNISTKTTRENIEKSIELINEISFNTKLNNINRIKELLQQMKSRIEMSIFQMGNLVAANRVSSYFSPIKAYSEKVSGLDFYWFLSDLLGDFDTKADSLVTTLENVYKNIFNINNLIISFTGARDDFDLFMNKKDYFLNNLNKDLFKKEDYTFVENPRNEGIKSISNVQYVAKGYNFRKLGYEYNGAMNVLTTLLNIDYLHNKVRAQGGAYGVGISMGTTGALTTRSYRDPNLVNTIKVYDNMAEYISKLDLSDADLTSNIIGAIGSMDSPLTPAGKGARATNRYINGITIDELNQIRHETINTKLKDLKDLAPILKETMEKDYLCVLGNDVIIEENKDLFKEVKNLNK